MTSPFPFSENSQSETLPARYQRIRQTSLDLVAPLEIEAITGLVCKHAARRGGEQRSINQPSL